MAFIGTRRALLSRSAGFKGIGDVKSGITNYWGLRAYSVGYATGSNPALDLVDQAGANQITINILSNGKLDVASINAWVTAHSVTTILVKKIYDQVGSNPLTQATVANMPSLSLTALNSLPGIVFTSGSSTQLTGSLLNFPTGSSYSGVLKTQSGLVGYWGSNASGNLLYSNAANTGNIDMGTVATFTLSDNSYHAVNFAGNGASSLVNVDGASTGINPGTTTKQLDRIGQVNGFFSSMQFFELGLYLSTILSAGDEGNLNANQHAYWSF